MTITTTTQPMTKLPRRMAREPKAEQSTDASPRLTVPKTEAGPVSTPSKAAKVLAMLERPEGATIEQLAVTTGWLPHTTRAALTGLRKKGHVLASEKVEGGARIYRVATPPVTDAAEASA